MPVIKQLNADELLTIDVFGKSFFLKAQEAIGVPWEALAAVWYREASLQGIAHTPGGPFQFDPIPDSDRITALLKRYSNFDDEMIARHARRTVDKFDTATYVAACYLRSMAKPVITVNSSDDDIKDAFWGYNGRPGDSADTSAYVMANYDDAHQNMVIRGTIPDGNGGRKKVEVVDGRLGAFVVYRQLRDRQK